MSSKTRLYRNTQATFGTGKEIAPIVKVEYHPHEAAGKPVFIPGVVNMTICFQVIGNEEVEYLESF